MSKILVVDDSAVDRRLIGGLLQQDPQNEVDYAEDVPSALRQLRDQRPDLVVTDLHMPGPSGLELVAAVRLDHPGVPVILVTGYGHETLAAEALHYGAAGYVPKSILHQRLLEAVSSTLSLTRADKTYEKLITCLKRCEFRFKLTNELALIDPLVELVQQMVSGMDLTDPTGRFRIGAAIREGLLNGIIRGNLELSVEDVPDSHLVLTNPAASAKLFERAQQAPYATRLVDVQVNVLDDRVEIQLRDEGPGFDWQPALAAARAAEAVGTPGRRGLVLMQAFMDEVQYNEQGNELTLVKKSEQPAP